MAVNNDQPNSTEQLRLPDSGHTARFPWDGLKVTLDGLGRPFTQQSSVLSQPTEHQNKRGEPEPGRERGTEEEPSESLKIDSDQRIRAHSDSETKESYSSNSNMDSTQELRDIKNHLESLLSKKVTVPLRII